MHNILLLIPRNGHSDDSESSELIEFFIGKDLADSHSTFCTVS